MTRSRITILCIAVGLSGLVVNSSVALAAGLQPAIFVGPVFDALLVAWGICWLTYALAGPADRAEQRDRCERSENLSTAIHYWDGDDRTPSGSWRRPPIN